MFKSHEAWFEMHNRIKVSLTCLLLPKSLFCLERTCLLLTSRGEVKLLNVAPMNEYPKNNVRRRGYRKNAGAVFLDRSILVELDYGPSRKFRLVTLITIFIWGMPYYWKPCGYWLKNKLKIQLRGWCVACIFKTLAQYDAGIVYKCCVRVHFLLGPSQAAGCTQSAQSSLM